ncbi:hypothetical protein P152DRAFT_458376 [Eremomyces bilateralis CBS 781.70]|uniref:Uncharacterized protein n=1 Tax=Eremomyces bilateralis CBS 781.70 TaxID=1392243 RepID=A0A6G1G3Z0_9PEZI|nr:uncharacterized protein P152DRAFT_458376 [Eremomyces bilateralis CBS 781.70]KAF1812539.1 hypothetical protein P152DRAFT_458376 [Eremomyces bilateralis CBS 781.70]
MDDEVTPHHIASRPPLLGFFLDLHDTRRYDGAALDHRLSAFTNERPHLGSDLATVGSRARHDGLDAASSVATQLSMVRLALENGSRRWVPEGFDMAVYSHTACMRAEGIGGVV